MVILILTLVAAIAVLVGLALVASGRGGELAPAIPERPVLDLTPGRPLMPADVERVRFRPTFWGYRPAQVEEVLDRAVRALAERDTRISELEQQLLARQLAAEVTRPVTSAHPSASADRNQGAGDEPDESATSAGSPASGEPSGQGESTALEGTSDSKGSSASAESLTSMDAEEAW